MVELLIVVSVMGVMATLIIPAMQPNLTEQARATAEVVAAEIAYARNLAVANNTTYLLTFDRINETITLTHSGASAALDDLPPATFPHPSNTSTQQVFDFTAIPQLGARAVFVSAVHIVEAGGFTVADTLEFGPLGETTAAEETKVLLRIGRSNELRWIAVRVHPVTGLVEVGEPTTDIREILNLN